MQRLPVDGETPSSALGENHGRQLIVPSTAWLVVPPARHFPEGFGGTVITGGSEGCRR